jgi:hypothetical protein
VEGPGRKRSTDNSTNSCISRFTLCNNYVVCPAEVGLAAKDGALAFVSALGRTTRDLGLTHCLIDICIAFFVGWMWFVRLIWGGDRIGSDAAEVI